MRSKSIAKVGVALAAALTAMPANAQNYVNSNRIMVAGSTLLLGHYAAVNASCASLGSVTVRISNAPSSGKLQVKQASSYSRFSGDYAQCNTRKVSGASLYYVPQKGFVGTDSMQVDVFYPNGNERIENFSITVK